jgi:hypothetical protein
VKRLAFAALAVVLVSSVALADNDKDKDKDKGRDKSGVPAASGSAAMAAPSGMPAGAASGKMGMGDDDDDEGPPAATDGGKPVAGRRTPAQIALRKAIWERREKAIESKVHKGGKRLTEEEREAIRKHYLNVSRLMRIRELAQEDKADAIVKRADAALEKEEKGFDAKLEKLNAKAGAK